MVRLRIVLIAFLLMLLFVPAAGAIYIPGQETPDDGLYHIMSGGDAVPAYQGIPYEIALPSLMPANLYGISVYPVIEMPQIDENWEISMEDVIGDILTLQIPGFWEGIDLESLDVNMPLL